MIESKLSQCLTYMLFLEGMSSKGCEEKGQFVLDASTAGAAKEAH